MDFLTNVLADFSARALLGATHSVHTGQRGGETAPSRRRIEIQWAAAGGGGGGVKTKGMKTLH